MWTCRFLAQLYQNSRFPCQSFRFFVRTPGAQCGIGKWELDPGPPMRRRSSASEGRFGAAEPEGCASIRVVGPYRFAVSGGARSPSAPHGLYHRVERDNAVQYVVNREVELSVRLDLALDNRREPGVRLLLLNYLGAPAKDLRRRPPCRRRVEAEAVLVPAYD